MADERMKSIFHRWAAAALGLAIAATTALPALAAAGTPRIVGMATQASDVSGTLQITTTGVINPAETIILVAAGDLVMFPTDFSCACSITPIGDRMGSTELPYRHMSPSGFPGTGRVRTFATLAGGTISVGTTFSVTYAGPGGAKSAVLIAVPDGLYFGDLAPTYTTNGPGNWRGSYTGTGTSIGWTCAATECAMRPNLLMVAASVITGGSSDTYTEDAGWTFLGQTGAGAWPKIRIAYKSTGAGGNASYALTNGTSRDWLTGVVFLR